MVISHETGISDSYYRPTEKELLDDYLKDVDVLTINDQQRNNVMVQKQLQELTEKNKEEVYILKGQLAEKEREAEQAKKALAAFENKQKEFQEGIQNRQKQIEDKMYEMQEKIFERLSLEHNPPLNQIKSKKKREDVETKLMIEAGERMGIGEDYDEDGNPIPDIYDEDND